MHELSIAEAIFEQARRHVPPGGRLRSVTVQAGPMRGIDPQFMDHAWQTLAGEAAGSPAVRLELRSPPWLLSCAACGREWTADNPNALCACGTPGSPQGGDELLLLSIDVDMPEITQVNHASTSG